MTELEVLALILSHLFVGIVGLSLGKYIQISISFKNLTKKEDKNG